MAAGKSPTDLSTQLEMMMSEFQMKLSQKDETIKALTTDKSLLAAEIDELKATVRDLKLNSKDDASVKLANLEKAVKLMRRVWKAKDNVINDLRGNLEKVEKEKLDFQEAHDKMRVLVENMGKMLNHDGGSSQTQTEKEVAQVPGDVEAEAEDAPPPDNDSYSNTEEVIDLTQDDDDEVYDNVEATCSVKRVKLEETPGIDNFMEDLDEEDNANEVVNGQQDFNTMVTVKMEESIIPKASTSSRSVSPQRQLAVFQPNHRRDTFRMMGFWCKCGKQFSSERLLWRHIHYFTQRLFACNKCGKEYAYWCYLKSHLKRKHNAVVLGGKVGCSLCGRQFATRAAFREHRLQFHSSS